MRFFCFMQLIWWNANLPYKANMHEASIAKVRIHLTSLTYLIRFNSMTLFQAPSFIGIN